MVRATCLIGFAVVASGDVGPSSRQLRGSSAANSTASEKETYYCDPRVAEQVCRDGVRCVDLAGCNSTMDRCQCEPLTGESRGGASLEASGSCPYHDGFDIAGKVCPFQYGDDATGAHCGDDGSGVSSDGWACYLYGSAIHQGSVDLAAYVQATYGEGYCAKNPSGDKCLGWGVYGPGCGAC